MGCDQGKETDRKTDRALCLVWYRQVKEGLFIFGRLLTLDKRVG